MAPAVDTLPEKEGSDATIAVETCTRTFYLRDFKKTRRYLFSGGIIRIGTENFEERDVPGKIDPLVLDHLRKQVGAVHA